jgi:putative ABC transport system ATP-binding protein
MLQISDLSYRYPRATAVQLVVPAFNLAAGQHAILVGPSGSGKSTLLHLIAAILKPQSGKLTVTGTDVASLSPRSADDWRGRTIGFLPQKLALIPSLTARENILLAAYASDQPADVARADVLLHALGVAEKASSKPHQLSQGQRQRIALARAMFNRPKLLLVDEPTANLDDEACKTSIELLISQTAEIGASLIIATHDARVLGALPQANVLQLPVQPALKASA